MIIIEQLHDYLLVDHDQLNIFGRYFWVNRNENGWKTFERLVRNDAEVHYIWMKAYSKYQNCTYTLSRSLDVIFLVLTFAPMINYAIVYHDQELHKINNTGINDTIYSTT